MMGEILEGLIEQLDLFKGAIVTGPQRSGTRLASKILAKEKGWEYIDEAQVSVDSVYKTAYICERREGFVIQAPGLMFAIHDLVSHFSPNILAVVMVRDVDYIIASEERIGWGCHWLELAKYGRSSGRPSEVKYWRWEVWQQMVTPHWAELKYPEDLCDHPMWLDNHTDLCWSQTQF